MFKKLLLSTTSFFFLLSCSGIKPINENSKSNSPKETELEIIENKPLVQSISNIVVQPGKVEFVEFEVNLESGKYELDCKGVKTPIVVEKKQARFFMSENYFSDLKPFTCKYNSIDVLNVRVEKFPYKDERLNVDKKRVDLSKKALARHWKEKAILKKIYKQSAGYFLFDKPFKVPLTSYITSHYGNRRTFNNKKKTQHFGNDLRAAVGVPIPVANKGKVVFTGDLFFAGNIVIVDHGLNIFTTYGHLSKIKVTAGMIINQGDIVGLAGATGRVSGPHLHWGVKINNNWVDGFSLIEKSKKMNFVE